MTACEAVDEEVVDVEVASVVLDTEVLVGPDVVVDFPALDEVEHPAITNDPTIAIAPATRPFRFITSLPM